MLKLRNRIQLLKKEEEMANKKIDDTRRKAENMLHYKTEKEELMRRKIVY